MIQLMLVVSFLVCVFLLLVMLSNDRKRLSSILFIWILSIIAAWTVAIFLFLFSPPVAIKIIAAKLIYALATVFPPLFLLFAVRYPRENTISRSLMWLSAVPTIALLAVVVFYERAVLPIESVVSSSGFYGVDNLTYIWFALHFCIFFFAAILVAGAKFIKHKGREKYLIGLYAIGMILASIPGFYADLWLPYIGDYSMIWIGPVAVVMFLVLVAYGIIRHRLFDIRMTFVSSTAYILTFALLGVVYYFIAYQVSGLLIGKGAGSDTQVSINIIVAMILAVFFQNIRNMFSGITDKIIYQKPYSQEKFSEAIRSTVVSTVELRDLMKQTANIIAKSFEADSVVFWVGCGGTSTVIHRGRKPDGLMDNYEYLCKKINITKDVLLTASIDDADLRNYLQKLDIEMVVPLRYGGKTESFITIGHHKKLMFDLRDVAVLSRVTGELSIAVQNAISVQKIKKFNESLSQEINRATADLRVSNKKLKALDRSKDEFISLTSHQLRTPLTTIKGYLSMMLDGDAGQISRQQRKFLEEAFNSSQRMVHLVNDFLNISRIQTGRFDIELTEVSLADVLDEEIQLLRISASPRRIILDYQKPDNFPKLLLDEGKLRQVMMNFIDNAIHYSPSDSVIKISLVSRDSSVDFMVKDQGIGVPKSEQHKLFVKFARATNAHKQRPDGTGIGLFMAKKVVVALGGSIIFESVEGKGSTFGFRIPIKK